MISSVQSVDSAVEHVKKGFKEWLEKEAGFCMFLDFRFATRELFDEYQRRLRRDHTEKDTAVFHVQYGRSYGPFPRTIRTFYPLSHESFTIIAHATPDNEITAANSRRKSAARAEKRKTKQKNREKQTAPY